MNEIGNGHKLPVLIIGYSREQGIKNLLESINPNRVKSIHLALDGFKSDEVSTVQKNITSFISNFCEGNAIPLKTWVREKNLGVAASIISAIDWFFSEVPFGVILEDDLIIGEDFFDFMIQGLNFLEYHHDVLMVSGDGFIGHLMDESAEFFTNYPLIWGWGTTSAKWLEIRMGILSGRNAASLLSLNKRKNFWRVGALRVLRGQIDTWDIPFADFMISQNKYCLFPSGNLVSNTGNDEFAIHTTSEEFPLNLSIQNWQFGKSFDIDELQSKCKQVNILLDKDVFKIKFRHSLLGIFYLLRSSVGLERPKNETLAHRLSKVRIPSVN